MTYTTECSLRDFSFWGGGEDTRSYLTDEEIDTIEKRLEDMGEMLSDIEINDIFWFDVDIIAEWLGYSSFAEIMNREV